MFALPQVGFSRLLQRPSACLYGKFGSHTIIWSCSQRATACRASLACRSMRASSWLVSERSRGPAESSWVLAAVSSSSRLASGSLASPPVSALFWAARRALMEPVRLLRVAAWGRRLLVDAL